MAEYKVVVVGAGEVGKTAIILQFVSSHFEEKYDPTVEDLFRKEITVDGSRNLLEIIDTAGMEQFASMRDLYIQSGEGFLLVYSVAVKQSFVDVQPLREHIDRVKKGLPSPIILVGNKCDLKEERSVSKEDGERLAHEWGCTFFETSAKTGENVQEVFQAVVQEMKGKRSSKHSQKSSCCVWM